MAHTIMRRFRLNEISGVDRPAQKGALAVIMKRDTSKPGPYLAKADLPAPVQAYLKNIGTADAIAKGEAMADGTFPIANRDDLEKAIRAIGCAKDGNAAKNHVTARARALDATSLLPTGWSTAKSIGGDLIMEITRLAPRELPGLLENVVKAEEIEAEIAKMADKKVRKELQAGLQVAKSAVVASAWSIVDEASPGDVPSLLRKNFAEYKDHVVGLAPRGADTGDEIMLKAIAKSLGLTETATEADIQKALDAQLALANMSGIHKHYMEAMGDKLTGGRDAFIALTTEKRDELMKAAPPPFMPKDKKPAPGDDEDENDCMKVDGRTINKADVGEAVFTVLKAQQVQINKAADERAVSAIAKRIEPATKFIIGKAEDTAAILHRMTIGKATKADAEAVEKMLVSSSTVIGKSDLLTKEYGKVNASSEGTGSAIDQINAQASELVKNDKSGKMSIAKARTQVRSANPELAKQEQDEAAAARKAA